MRRAHTRLTGLEIIRHLTDPRFNLPVAIAKGPGEIIQATCCSQSLGDCWELCALLSELEHQDV